MAADVPTFAQWLKFMRAARDLTQKALAEQISCSVRTIEKIERGERQPSRQIAELVARYFNIPQDEHEAFLRFARASTSPVLPGWTAVQESLAREPRLASDSPDTLIAGLYETFPTPSQRQTGRNSNIELPKYAPPFIGRATEMESVSRLLMQDGINLLTITGPPGVGKTRLAAEVAGQLGDSFRDGVCFVRLAQLHSATQVIPALMKALRAGNAEDRTVVEGAKDYLMGKQMLLVLDNFEHVIAAAQPLVEILEASPGIKMLVTSREVLNVSLEHEFVVPPLSVPNGSEPGQIRHPETCEAVQLFVHRARAVRPDFKLNDENMEAVATICRVVEGLPLSIELAAARTKLIAPQAMVERLDSRLAFLTGGSRDLPRRHQTLRDAIGWSYSLLAEPEALLFRRVAVFAGGYTLQAIEQVCNADHGLGTEATDVVDLVTSLVEKSLLALDSDANDEPRYSMLETIREYAQEKLEESGEIEANRQQYVGYFLRLVEQAEPELRGPNQNVWLERLQRDHRNLCAALEGITETGQTELLLKVAPTLGQFWTRCGHWALGREQLEALLAEPRVLWQPSDKARTLYPLAYMAYLQGDYPYALACLEESLSLFRQEADGAGIADSLNLMGFVISMQGDKERARRLHAEGLDVARAAEYRLGVPFALYGIALIDIHAGNTASAHALTQESYIESRKIGDLLGIAYSLYSMGLADWLEGNYSEAREHCQESLRIHRQIQDKRGMALSLQVLGHISGQEGDVDDVNTRDRYLKESLSLLSKVGLRRYVPGTLAGLAMVALEQGDLAAAARLLGAADSSAKAAGAHVVPGQQPMQEAAIRRLLRTRDKAQMAEAWAEGEALSFQEVVALALDRPRPRI